MKFSVKNREENREKLEDKIKISQRKPKFKALASQFLQ